MNMVVRLLTEDHAHFRGLLDVLRVESARIEAGEPIWFDLLDDVVSYLHDYAEAVHHPVEEYLVQTLPRPPSTIGAMRRQHGELERRLSELRAAFAAVHDDHPQRRAPLVTRLNQITESLSEHIDWEESQLFGTLAACDDGPWLQTDVDGNLRCGGILLRPLPPRFQNLIDWQGAVMRHAARLRSVAAL